MTPGAALHGPSRLLVGLRAMLVLAAIGLAYHYSLLTLLRNLAVDTPLAYLGLVPLIALVLAAIAGRRWRWEPDVHDRYVDYIVGIPLLLIALIVVLVGPVALSSFFWRWRLDLLTLPVFVAGAVTIVFGLRTTLRLRVAIAFLLLAWPLPYTLLLDGVLQAFTDATTASLRAVLHLVPVARAVGGGDGSLFFVPYGSDGFEVSVASSCSGANGALGFMLIGGALMGVSAGNVLRKAHWLANGLLITLGLNVARILAIFAAGHQWGAGFALDALHPMIGLATFNLGVVASVLAMPLFGLRFESRPWSPPRPPAAAPRAATSAGPRHLPVRRASIALCLVVAASALAGTADAGLSQFQLVAGDLGQPRLADWSPMIAGVPGWSVRLTDSYPWVVQYFGQGATWNRYAYLATTAASPRSFVNLDVVSTWDLGTFSTYGLEACYGFHNYQVLGASTVELGAGVIGHSIAYYNPSTYAGWTALYWEWPVRSGTHERYERIILNLPNQPGLAPVPAPSTAGPFAAVQLAFASLFGGSPAAPSDPQLISQRDFLVAFARQLIAGRTVQTGLAPAASS